MCLNVLPIRHTTPFPTLARRWPQGEIRANLVMPGGVVTYQYNTTMAFQSSASMGGAVNVYTLPVLLNVFAFGLTGPPTMIHVHGPAAIGAASGVLITLCGPPPSTSCSLPMSNTAASFRGLFQQTFTVQMPDLASFGLAYVNVHTSANPSGELRAQIAAIKPLPSLSVPISLVPTPTPTPIPPPSNPGGNSNTDTGSPSKALSGGDIAGIVIGSILGAVVIAIVSFVLFKRYQTRRAGGNHVRCHMRCFHILLHSKS
jgi:hypothetical protein